MKKRILPSGFWALFVGFSFLLFAPSANAGNPGGSVTRQKGQGAGAIATDQINQIRANQATGIINPKDVLKAQEQVKLHAAKSAGASTLNWIPVGPNNAAGKTRAVIFDNRDATNNTLYAGGVSGGIWKSDNLGLVWKEVNTASNEVLRVSCMVQLPSGAIYVGTGESYCSTVGEVGTGLYTSTDGTDFTPVPGTQPLPNNTTADWAYISKLTCNSSGRLFAATNTGLKYSSDNGASWQTSVAGNAVDVVVGPDGTVLAAVNNAVYLAPLGDMSAIKNISEIDTSGLPNVNVGWIQFAIAPSDANIMYASIAKSTGALYNVYRSTNRGITWSVIFPGNSTYDPFDGNGCANNVIAVCPNNPDKVLLGGTNLWTGVKYDASYFNWQVITNGVYYPEEFPYYLPSFHHGYVFNPGNPNQIIVASDKGLSKGSINPDNISFTPINLDFVIGRMTSVALSTYKDGAMGGGKSIGTQVVFGGDILNEPMTGTQVWIDNGLGGDGGSGGMCAWSMIKPTVLIMSQQGVNPPWRRSEDLGVTPSPTFLTTGTAITNTKVPVAPLYLYENFNDLNSFDSISYKAGLMTIPADSLLVLPSDNEKFPFRYVTPVEIPKGTTVNIQDVVQTRFFVSGTKSVDGIYMTKDVLKFSKNPEWFCIASTPNTNPPVSCFDVSKDLNYIWTGTTGGYLYRVSNVANAHDSLTADINSPGCIVKTSTFDTIQYPFLAGRYVTSISVSADNQKVILTLGNYGNENYVYYSSNALDSIPAFHLVQGDLPSMPVYCSMFEKDNLSKVIIGTDFGAYSTDNIGAAQPSWTAETTGSGNVPVTAIKQQTNPGVYYYRPENFGTIVMSTYGRGMFRDTTYRTVLGIDPGTVANNAYRTVRIQPNPFRDMVNVDMTLDKASNVKVYVYDLTGKLVNSATWSNVGAGQQTRSLNLSALQAGTYIISVDYGTGKAYGKAVKTQ